ncbi:MAG: type II toxin-antitoxin system RelE/ParE family toxin [Verrucomicrobiaceae bacterium]|nr:type II toxin-antitoxin system RelE/ParE family toxin [Verrucomicrobiaceae bacterium]
MNFRFLSPALFELTEAAEYYETQVCGLGSDFLEEIDAAIERLLNFPKAWSMISPPFRACSLHRFPYSIIYKEESLDEILILSVFHQHRDPMSWQRNL